MTTRRLFVRVALVLSLALVPYALLAQGAAQAPATPPAAPGRGAARPARGAGIIALELIS